MTKRCILAGVLLAAAFVSRASDSSPAYSFLNIPASVTSYGLGGLNISTVNDDVNNIDVNPALLGPEMDKYVGLNYMHYIAGSNFAGARFALRANDVSAWAVSLQYFDYGSIQAADETGEITGKFSPKDLSVSAMYSRNITDRLRGGAAVKMLYSAYEAYTAFALATDLGINYYDPDRDLSLSLTVANLGGQVKRFTDSYDRLPLDVRLGWTQSFGSLPIRFNITAWNLTNWKSAYYDVGDGTTDAQPELKENFASNLFRHLIFGLDFAPSDKFGILLGYNYKVRSDMSTYSRNFLSGFSLGVSFRVRQFGIAAAYAMPHSGVSTFMFNISTSINDFLK